MNIADIRVTIELHSDGHCTLRIADENTSAGGKSYRNAREAVAAAQEQLGRELTDDIRQRTGRIGNFISACERHEDFGRFLFDVVRSVTED